MGLIWTCTITKKERHEEQHSIGKNVAKVKLPIQGDKPVEISQWLCSQSRLKQLSDIFFWLLIVVLVLNAHTAAHIHRCKILYSSLTKCKAKKMLYKKRALVEKIFWQRLRNEMNIECFATMIKVLGCKRYQYSFILNTLCTTGDVMKN